MINCTINDGTNGQILLQGRDQSPTWRIIHDA